MLNEIGKWCAKCREWKPLSNFNRNKTRSDGYCHHCKTCRIRFRRKATNRTRTKTANASKEWKRKNRIRYREIICTWYKSNIGAAAAHSRIYKAIRKGTIKRKPCAICGNEKSHAHHFNYSNPYKVVFLCAKHHKQLHNHTLAPSF